MVDIFQNLKQKHRPYINADAVRNFGQAGRFSRKSWGLLRLELWHQSFHDRAGEFRALLDAPAYEEEVVQE